MPNPTSLELKDKKGQSHYVSRCVEFVMNENPKMTQSQALGRCYGMYESAKKHKQSQH